MQRRQLRSVVPWKSCNISGVSLEHMNIERGGELPTAIQIVMGIVFALLGRWVQLHPERVVPKGHFVGPNTFGARLFRAQTVVIGGFAVFGGTWIAVSKLLTLVSFDLSILAWIAQFIGVAAGAAAVSYVRKEVKKQPPYVSNTPYGWWP